MRKQTPEKVELLSYEWALALQRKNFDAAQSIVEQAKSRRFAKAEVMERITDELASPWPGVVRWGGSSRCGLRLP